MGFSLQCSGRSHSTEQQNIDQRASASNRAPKHYPMEQNIDTGRSKVQQNIDQGETKDVNTTPEVRPYMQLEN